MGRKYLNAGGDIVKVANYLSTHFTRPYAVRFESGNREPYYVDDKGYAGDLCIPLMLVQELPLEPEEKDEPKLEEPKPTQGLRYNKGKIRYSVLSPAAMETEAMVTLFGGMKYDDSNYKKFKNTEEEAKQEFIDCIFRHLMKIIKGEDFDQESLLLHAGHITWNANRLIDLHFYGMNHMKGGKDLYQQPYRNPMLPVPTEENFEEIWGMVPHSGGKRVD